MRKHMSYQERMAYKAAVLDATGKTPEELAAMTRARKVAARNLYAPADPEWDSVTRRDYEAHVKAMESGKGNCFGL